MIKKRIFESGRSLVEMLGVLAVIGVLSVGAIAGYRRAMDSQKASATIAELNQYAFLASQQALQKRADLDLSELGNVTNQGYPVSAVVQADPTFFEIFLKDVPASICERILDSDWSIPLVMFANNYAYTGETGICDNGEDELADMAFQFKEDLNPDAMPMGGCVQDSDCKGSCVKCENQQCVSTCVGSERCANDQATGEKVCCPSEKRAGPMCCSSTQNGWCCNASGQCFPWHKPLVSKSGTSYACDYDGGVDVTGVESNCNACPEREVYVNGSSSYCAKKCSDDKPLRSQTGQCYSCDDKEIRIAQSADMPCTEICPNREKAGAYNWFCSPKCGENQLHDNGGGCHDCDTTGIVNVGGADKECSKCKNRTLSGSSCFLTCPDGQLRGNDGLCHTCEETEPIPMLNAKTDCAKTCPNRKAQGGYSEYCALPCGENEFVGADAKCYSCSTENSINVYTVQHTGCDMCKNRMQTGTDPGASFCVLNCPAGQFRGSDNVCYDCTESNRIAVVAKAVCDICSNRSYTSGYCSVTCDKNEFMANDGQCWPCQDTQNMWTGSAQCVACSDTRNQYNNMCVPKCPAETPLRGSDNKCYACDDPANVPVSGMTDACYECPDERKLDGSYCVLK